MKIIAQQVREDGVFTTYEDGSQEVMPYEVDSDGSEYVEMFPNDPETRLNLR